LYAANEVGTFSGQETGSVSAFAIDRATDKLAALNQESSVVRGPVYLVVDKTGRNVLVSNYMEAGASRYFRSAKTAR
jgi:6-phosphogluconolactonase